MCGGGGGGGCEAMYSAVVIDSNALAQLLFDVPGRRPSAGRRPKASSARR